MLFLLNDIVLSLKEGEVKLPEAIRSGEVSFDDVLVLCAEAFSANPMLHRTDPIRAHKIAALIAAKAPEVNAAVFIPPAPRCAPQKVAVRYCQLTFDVIGGLSMRQLQGRLTTADVDDQVWQRLAAA